MTTDEADQFLPGEADLYVEYHGAPERSVAVRVAGDSMAPDGYANGDIIIAAPDGAQPGEVAVIVYEDPDTGAWLPRLKRYHPQGQTVELRSSNPAYRSVHVPREKVLHVLAGR